MYELDSLTIVLCRHRLLRLFNIADEQEVWNMEACVMESC